jgi:hypothetical protein
MGIALKPSARCVDCGMIFTCPDVRSHPWRIGSNLETKVYEVYLKPVFLSCLKNLGSAPPVADARMRFPPEIPPQMASSVPLRPPDSTHISTPALSPTPYNKTPPRPFNLSFGPRINFSESFQPRSVAPLTGRRCLFLVARLRPCPAEPTATALLDCC